MVGEMRLVDTAPYTTRQLDCGTADLRDRLIHSLWNEHADLLDRADLVAFLHRPSQGLQAGLLALCRTPAELVCPSTLQARVSWRIGTVEMHASALCGRLSGDPTRWDRETRDMPRRREVANALLVAYYALELRGVEEQDRVAVFERGAVSPHFQGWPAGPKGERWRDALFRGKK